MEIKGKIIAITGASKGIGKSLALMLADKGAKLSLSARSADLLQEVAGQTGEDTFLFPADLSKESAVRDYIKATIKHYGRIDVLINNVGIGIFKSISETTIEDWDKMFNLNIRGVFIATQEALPALRSAGESVIVNVASLAGKNPVPNGAAYAATKHAMLGFGRTLMLEERSNGVRVLTICPGSVDTPFFREAPQPFKPGTRGEIINPEDVASSIIHMIELPQNAMVSEIDIRPSDPKKKK